MVDRRGQRAGVAGSCEPLFVSIHSDKSSHKRRVDLCECPRWLATHSAAPWGLFIEWLRTSANGGELYSPEAFSVSGLRSAFVIFGFSVLQMT